MFRFVVFGLAALLARAALDASSLRTCNIGVGLSPWRYNGDWDSRLENNAIECADGALPTSRGITVVNPNSEFVIRLRSLGRGLIRQGVMIDPLRFTTSTVQIVGICMTNTLPTGMVSLTAMNTPPYFLDACAGEASATSGSPFFQQRTDDGAAVSDNPGGLRQGWAIRNPPSYGTVLGQNIGCNWLWSCTDALAGMACPLATSLWADSAGLAPFVAWNMMAAATVACSNGMMMMDRPPPWTGTATEQLYGGRTTILESYSTLSLGPQWSVFTPVTPLGVGWPAHFLAGEANALAFQLGCAVSSDDETKFISITFVSPGSAPNNADLILGNAAPIGAFTNAPDTVEGTITIACICQNEETDTPTPPLYPLAPVPSPGAAPSPLTPATRNTASVIIAQCTSLCNDPKWQEAACAAVSQKCLENGHVGCNCQVTCSLDVTCEEYLSTTSVSSGRRGLKQATLTFYKTVIIATAKIVQTATFLANAIRQGQLNPWVNAFSNLRIVFFNSAGTQSEVPFSPPSAASPIADWPSVLAPWTGSTEVYGTCRDNGCVATCSNVPIQKVSDFSLGADISCFCKTCQASLLLTQYYFLSFFCGNSVDQATADACAFLVMQDAVCWALSQTGLSLEDTQAIAAGAWLYRAASIGTPVPQPVRLDGPRSCPDTSSSNKGLLGLLGLLGIIPIVLCCLLLLLCLLRRKKREGDVHFATFDPQAANLAGPSVPCPSVPMGCPSLPMGMGMPGL